MTIYQTDNYILLQIKEQKSSKKNETYTEQNLNYKHTHTHTHRNKDILKHKHKHTQREKSSRQFNFNQAMSFFGEKVLNSVFCGVGDDRDF